MDGSRLACRTDVVGQARPLAKGTHREGHPQRQFGDSCPALYLAHSHERIGGISARTFLFFLRGAPINLPLPTDAKETDVPAHSWIMPTLMKHAGITFYHLGANPTNQFMKLPELFWWEGPDGSRVLTMFSKGYAGGTFPPADWKFKTWLTLVHAGD